MAICRALGVALLTIVLAACQPPGLPFKGVDLSQRQMGGEFTLKDAQGKDRTLADYRDKVVVLFFGYTQCPDVCPTTLGEMRVVMQKLGAARKQVQVLFVTLDPARDTPELLAQYVPAFDASFVGLRGTQEQTAAMARQYSVVAQRNGSGANYTIDHTASIFVLDRQGKPRVLLNYGTDPAIIRHDIELLLNER